MAAEASNPPRLASLDGMRGVAIAIVMLGHTSGSEGGLPWATQLVRFLPASVGVQIFFTISGFIITHLLIREHAETGHLTLSAFWIRRAMRILPPLIVMLATLTLMSHAGWIQVSSQSQWASVFFFRNHVPGGWFNGHIWSLSVEEQFYLCWPLFMAWFLGRRRVSGLGSLIALAVLARFFFVQTGRGGWATYSLIGNLDGLVMGAWAALQLAGISAWPERQMLRLARWWFVLLPLVAVANYLTSTRYALWAVPVQPVIISLLTAAIIRGQLSTNASLLHRFLNLPGLTYLGRMSYSIYLWQQLFLCPIGAWSVSMTWFTIPPWNLGCSLMVGWLSWRFIEVPCAAVRSRMSTPRSRSCQASPG